MKGGYDLYGTYYPNLNDALNAEMAQCAEIDNRIQYEQIKKLENKVQQQQSNNEAYLMDKIQELEQRIAMLESNQQEE